MFQGELEEFKTRIDLRSYAAGQGYFEDRKHSYKGVQCMRHASGDKIYIKRDLDDHYLYVSTRDARDHGSIIDFVAHRKHLDLKQNRKDWRTVGEELRPWLGKPPVPVPSFPSLEKTRVTKDRTKVEAAYARMQDASAGHPYLERERALPCALLALDRFEGRVRLDNRGNAVFPHFDGEGLSGYELKNIGFTGFASGGTKALWMSHELPGDKRLVVCEGAIDALSHAVLFPDNDARYASIGGKPSAQQPELIRAAVARMPNSSEIVSAMDADAGGRDLAEIVKRAVELTGRHDLRFTVHEPEGAKDWNDLLRARPLPLLPFRPDVPSVA
jgi:hypothetical protein